MRRSLAVLAVAALTTALAGPAFGAGGPIRLRYRVRPGLRRVYEDLRRTETVVESGGSTSRRVTEIRATREVLVVETGDDPPQMRLVTLETPTGERLVALEENGRDRLGEVPETQRLRPMPPLLAAHRRHLTGRPLAEPPPLKTPMRALELAIAELGYLPDDPVGPDRPAVRKVDLGIAQVEVTTRLLAPEAGTPPAEGSDALVLENVATVTFTGPWAEKITVRTLRNRAAWAADGSGLLSVRGTLVLEERAGKAVQHLTRTWQTRRTHTDHLDPEALAKTKANLETLERAMADARAGRLDSAVDALGRFIQAEPDHPWTPAVRSLHAALIRQRLISQPVKPARLRLMLRDLQASRDRAAARGQQQVIAQIDQTLRQVVRTNAAQVLADAADPDPIVRDLAAFGLAFLDDPQAPLRLRAMATGDPSAQIRGTALVSLAIRGEKAEPDLLLKALKDENDRVRGAAALLAAKTLKRTGDAGTDLVPALAAALTSDLAWTRTNAAAALGNLAPKGSLPAVQALADALEKETEAGAKTVYLAALEALTGVKSPDRSVEPYRTWLRTHQKGGSGTAAEGAGLQG